MIIGVGFFARMEYFQSLDEPAKIEYVTPERYRDLGGFSDQILVGLTIERFKDFDIQKNNFQFMGNLWFEFDAGTVSLETLGDFSFHRATLTYVSKPETRLINDRLLVRYIIKASFNAGLVYNNFPLDNHRISLVLTHPFIAPEEILFESSINNFVLSGDLLPFGWKIVGTGVETGYLESSLLQFSNELTLKHPIAAFSIDVKRYGARHALAILLPMFLLLFLMSFALATDEAPGIGITLGGITGLLAYRYVIEQMSPVSGELMLSDKFFFLVLISSLMIFLFNMIDLFIVTISMRKKHLVLAIIYSFAVLASAVLLAP